MEYSPKPLPTAQVELSPELMALRERLAENAHEVWAYRRMRQGWVYGKKRDDDRKTHPCLVPYQQLSEEEKEYDRNTALETLRLIISMGYKIIKE